MMYIVEWDLPADNRRKRFYRALDRYYLAYDVPRAERSTASVLFTDNEHLAWHAYREARKVGGTAHVYEARRLDTDP